MANEIIRNGQIHSVNFTDFDIDCDGVYGAETRANGIRCIQFACNKDYGSGLKVDGIFGVATAGAIDGHNVRLGETQYLVTAVEIVLMLKGYDPGGVECPGVFGEGLKAAVIQFQKDNGLEADGIVGVITLRALMGVDAEESYIVAGGSDIRSRIVQIAAAQVGYCEDDNGVTKFGIWMGMPTAEWCHCFVSWCCNQAGVGSSVVPYTAYVPAGIQFFIESDDGCFYSRRNYPNYGPKPGDFIYFDWDDSGDGDHVGLVADFDGETVTTIEGNTGEDSLYCRKKYWSIHSPAILGFGVPAFGGG